MKQWHLPEEAVTEAAKSPTEASQVRKIFSSLHVNFKKNFIRFILGESKNQ